MEPLTAVGAAEHDDVDGVVLPAQGVELSGLLATPRTSPRALVLALHGGGMTAGYFHGRAHRDLSLLRLGSHLGFSVLALDRPGYGRSSGALPDGLSLQEQAAMVRSALDSFASTHDTGVGVFVVGHSYGLKLALHLAAAPRGATLLGLDGSGAGYRYSPELAPGAPASESVADHRSSELATGRRRHLFWGAEALYPPTTFDPGMRPVAPMPLMESRETGLWTDQLPALAAQLRVPYQFTVAEHERWWQVTDEALAEYQALFTHAPAVSIRRQAGAGHNISLGWAARAYHLTALAFAEQCLLGRTTA
jgi:pimeloyl-ACP methyl ester carboxylesterase